MSRYDFPYDLELDDESARFHKKNQEENPVGSLIEVDTRITFVWKRYQDPKAGDPGLLLSTDWVSWNTWPVVSGLVMRYLPLERLAEVYMRGGMYLIVSNRHVFNKYTDATEIKNKEHLAEISFEAQDFLVTTPHPVSGSVF